jgi:hypothetical protein
MIFASVDDEVFHCLQGLDHRSDLLNLLPMAAYVVRADGVVIWYNARAAELWGREPAVGDTDERFCGADANAWEPVEVNGGLEPPTSPSSV